MLESLDELKGKKEQLEKIGMSQKEINDLFVQINRWKISLLTLDIFFIENESNNDEATTSNNDIHDENEAVLFENFIEHYKKTHKAEFDDQHIEMLKSAFKQKLKEMKTKEKKSLVTFGSIMGTPIINQPQVAILAIGAIKKKPAVVETPYGDLIAIRHLMFLSLSYDHRVVDGALGSSFLRRIADYIENFDGNQDF